MAKLHVTYPDGTTQDYELGEYTTIGRMPGNTIQLLDPLVSKVHAQITRTQSGDYELRDLGSLNGTYIRGERIVVHKLSPGDEIMIGSLVFRFQEEGAPVLETEVESTDSVTSEIFSTVAVEDAGKFLPSGQIDNMEVLKQDYERLRIAHEVASYLGVEQDLEVLLNKILDKLFEVFPSVDRGAIFLPDSKDGRMVPMVSKSRYPGASSSIRVSTTILSEVITRRQAVLSADLGMDDRFKLSKSIIAEGIRSTMSVPMIYRSKLLGVIYLDSQMATGNFTKKDLVVLTGIASQVAVAVQNYHLIQEVKQRAQLEKLLSPNLVEQIVKGHMTLDQEGRLSNVTILFADIRGFTSMSEHMSARDIVAMLNSYFEAMVDVIFKFEGTLDKFVGDEIMALFGAPVQHEDSPTRSVECALGMMQALKAYNMARQADGKKPIAIGVGINSGEVVSGALGSSKTMQYTVVGDPVNVASRFCSIAKPGQIIIGESTYGMIDRSRFRINELPPVQVKGKSKPLRVFEVLDYAPGMQPSGATMDSRLS